MQPVPASPTVMHWRPIVAEAATRFALPASWIVRVMRAESGGQTMLNGQPITSRAGAMGLMQLMPETWTAMRTANHLGADPYDPHDNVLAGAAYLRLLYQRYGYPNLFAAYNAGPARLEDFLYRHRPLPAETTAYIARVLHADGTASDSVTPVETPASSTDPSGLFFVRGDEDARANPSPASPDATGALFVPLSSPTR
jgi:soluble lytic murein transglycosylase-like protein